MIKTEGLTTEVSFAKESGKGTISVQAYHNFLILQEILGDKKVSESLEDNDIKELPNVICNFQTTESIDVVIEILKRIKKNMEIPDDCNFALAS